MCCVGKNIGVLIVGGVVGWIFVKFGCGVKR